MLRRRTSFFTTARLPVGRGRHTVCRPDTAGIGPAAKLLAVTSEPISAQSLRTAIGAERLDDVEVMVVAPALHESALRFWMSDADEAIAHAHAVERQSVEGLRAEHVAASGDVGEGDLQQAVRDALVTFPADRILLFTHAPDERRYREEVRADELANELGIAVESFQVVLRTG